ncbi:MAG: triphosphoribosyl-dephospho-CoA synthase [Synergistaceae bacterium]|nr:triphosphoribosyl-dephospho-CoA synthase [Synergistaceae bacterium]
MNEVYIFNTAKSAVKSIILTASVYPKPGLITPIDSSALDGTEYPALLDAAMSLFQCFINLASAGADTESLKPTDAFTILKSPGRIGSNDSLTATRGKLAMKGHVLCMGLLCAAAGKLISQKRILTPGALTLTASAFAQGIASRELWPLTDTGGLKVLTAGEKAYMSYGLEGCRGEAEQGYIQTMKAAETLRKLEAMHGHLALRERLTHTLVTVIAENQDTDIAGRMGIGELMRVQDEAKRVLEAGGMLTPEGTAAVLDFDRAVRSRGVSPNGSGVILACAVLVSELVKMKLTRSGYDE